MNNQQKAEFLRKEIRALDELREKNVTKARYCTYVVLAIIIYIVLLKSKEFESLSDYLLGIPEAGILAIVIFFISAIIVNPVTVAGMRIEDDIKRLQKELYALEKEQE